MCAKQIRSAIGYPTIPYRLFYPAARFSHFHPWTSFPINCLNPKRGICMLGFQPKMTEGPPALNEDTRQTLWLDDCSPCLQLAIAWDVQQRWNSKSSYSIRLADKYGTNWFSKPSGQFEQQGVVDWCVFLIQLPSVLRFPSWQLDCSRCIPCQICFAWLAHLLQWKIWCTPVVTDFPLWHVTFSEYSFCPHTNLLSQ